MTYRTRWCPCWGYELFYPYLLQKLIGVACSWSLPISVCGMAIHIHTTRASSLVLGSTMLRDYLRTSKSIRTRDGCSSHETLDRRCTGLLAEVCLSFDADTKGRPAESESSLHVVRALGAQSCSMLEEPPSYVLVRTIVVCLLNDSVLPKLLIVSSRR